MNDIDLSEMAERSFGYGNWGADYWFIGPEQGMAKSEGQLLKRFEAWQRLGKRDLDDCKTFHREIGEYRWHGRDDQTVVSKLQSTWGRLILAALGHSGKVSDLALAEIQALEYQRHLWGALSGRTCVIELSGLAAHSHKVRRSEDKALLRKRLDSIQGTLLEQRRKPKFVLLYGAGRKGNCKEAWTALTRGAGFEEHGLFKVCKADGYPLVWGPHPTAPILGNTFDAWFELGTKLRHMTDSGSNGR